MLSHGALRYTLNAREARITPQSAVLRNPEPDSRLSFRYKIDKTWDGQHSDHGHYEVELFWVETQENDELYVGRSSDPWLARMNQTEVQHFPGKKLYYIDVKFTGPLFDDPEPPRKSWGFHPHEILRKCERMEMYFANHLDNFTRVAVTPHGQWHVQLFEKPGEKVKMLDYSRSLPLDVKNTLVADEWRCHVRIPLAYFPQRVNRINMFAMHNYNGAPHVDALTPVDEGGDPRPNLTLLEMYKKVEFDNNQLVKGGHNATVYWDYRFGELWPGR